MQQKPYAIVHLVSPWRLYVRTFACWLCIAYSPALAKAEFEDYVTGFDNWGACFILCPKTFKLIEYQQRPRSFVASIEGVYFAVVGALQSHQWCLVCKLGEIGVPSSEVLISRGHSDPLGLLK